MDCGDIIGILCHDLSEVIDTIFHKQFMHQIVVMTINKIQGGRILSIIVTGKALKARIVLTVAAFNEDCMLLVSSLMVTS